MAVLDGIRGRVPDVFEDKAGSAGEDLLAGERERRQRPKWRVWDILWGKKAAALIVATALVALGMAMVVGDLSVGDGPAPFVAAQPAPAAPHPEAGRALQAIEQVQASLVGRPLLLGPGGLPMVEHAVTGEVREITPVEVEYWEDSGGGAEFLDTGVGRVVWNPGPDGWGMWWVDDSENREVQPDVYFARSDWHAKQRDELEHAVRVLSLGLRQVSVVNLDQWRAGPSEELVVIASALRDTHPVVSEYGRWEAVPLQWHCSEDLEQRYRMYVSPGCPPESYMIALAGAWVSLGVVAEYLEAIGSVGTTMDSMGMRDLQESNLRLEVAYLLSDLLNVVGILQVSLERLRQESIGQELPIELYLFQGV